MRTLKRNKRPVAYAFYDGVQEIVDDDGYHTGEYEIKYTEPIKTLMNVSGGRGQADIALFGFTNNYARTLVTEDIDTPFTEETVFWIEADPDNEPHDYRVSGIARTINQVVLAVDKVETSSAGDGNG